MSKYLVKLSRFVREEIEVALEATDEGAAELEALEKLARGELEWAAVDDHDPRADEPTVEVEPAGEED